MSLSVFVSGYLLLCPLSTPTKTISGRGSRVKERPIFMDKPFVKDRGEKEGEDLEVRGDEIRVSDC